MVNLKLAFNEEGKEETEKVVLLKLKPAEFYKMLLEMERVKGSLQTFSGIGSPEK